MPRTAGEKNTVQMTLNVLLDDRAFIDELMKTRGHSSLADTLRELLQQFRTCFSLPPFMADRVEKDMAVRRLDIIKYTQELYGRRYQELQRQDEEKSSSRGKAS
jgi:hypothetical protein